MLLLRAYCAGKSIDDARAELTVFEETTEGLPSSGLMRRYSQVRRLESAWRELERAERHEMACADRIGLSPLARQKLGKLAQSASRGYGVDLGGGGRQGDRLASV